MHTVTLTDDDIQTLLTALRTERERQREAGESTANLERLSDKLLDALIRG